jgi:uncharacterized membrane protein YozB (DUF420 family)
VTATIAPPVVAADVSIEGRRFYVRMAAVCVAIAMIGFAPTYWMPLARGSLHVSPIVHVHGAFFFGWTIFFLAQTWLAGSGNITRHREVGVAGVALATGMCFLGYAVAVNSIRHFDALGFGPAGRAFSMVSFSAIAFFAVVVAIALLNVKNGEIHKRLMLVATASLLPAAIGRWFLVLFAPNGAATVGPPPLVVTLPASLLADLLIVAAMIYDRRTRGRVHPVYWIAGAALLIVQLARIPLGNTSGWLNMTYWLVAFVP